MRRDCGTNQFIKETRTGNKGNEVKEIQRESKRHTKEMQRKYNGSWSGGRRPHTGWVPSAWSGSRWASLSSVRLSVRTYVTRQKGPKRASKSSNCIGFITKSEKWGSCLTCIIRLYQNVSETNSLRKVSTLDVLKTVFIWVAKTKAKWMKV